MARNNSRQGQLFDDYSGPDIQLCFASNDDVEDLCRVLIGLTEANHQNPLQEKTTQAGSVSNIY